MLRLSVLLTSLMVALTAHSYIPRLEMIMDRLGRNHGYGFYLIDQEVIFPAQPNPLIVKEQWIVNTDGSYRLRVLGERELKGKLDLTLVINGDQKHYINANGVRKSTRVGSEFVDPLFFSNNRAKLIRQLKKFNIDLPNYNNLTRRADKDLNPMNPGRDNSLNLSRVGGKMAYAIGQPTEFSSSEKQPAVWVEQDQFHILKLRLPSQTEIIAKDYTRNSRGMFYPKTRIIQTPTETYQINLREVKPISGNSTNKRLVSRASLNVSKNPELKLKLPDIEIIKNFYQKYR